MKKSTLLLALILIPLGLFSQDVGITHYQGKSDSVEVQFPMEKYSSKGFFILVPDSMYSYGRITLKRAIFPEFKAKDYILDFKNNFISEVRLTLKRKSHIRSFTEMLETRYGERLKETEYGYIISMPNATDIKCVRTKVGAKQMIHLTPIQ